jgi:hypothetical protein
MNTRHIAFLGFTVSSFLAMALAGCSASDTPAKSTGKKDGGTTTSTTAGGGGSGNTTAGAGGNGPAGTGGSIVMNTTGGGGAGGGAMMPCTPPDKTMKAQVASDMLSDFGGMAPTAVSAVTPGGGWYSYQDPEMGTTFIPAPASFMLEMPGHSGMGSALHVAGSGFMGPASATNWGAGAGFSLGGQIAGGTTGMVTQPTDVSAYTGISFYAKSSMMSDISVQFATPDTDPSYCSCQAANLCYTTHAAVVPMIAAAWTKYTVKFTDLKQPTYTMAPVPFDPTSLLTINFASNGPLPMFDYWVDEVTLVK